jgi:hypothetical protein
MKLAQESGLQLRVGTHGLGHQAEEVYRLGSLANSLGAMRTVPPKVVAELHGFRLGERPEQEQLVKFL